MDSRMGLGSVCNPVAPPAMLMKRLSMVASSAKTNKFIAIKIKPVGGKPPATLQSLFGFACKYPEQS